MLRFNLRSVIASSIFALAIALGACAGVVQAQETVMIDAHAQATHFPHFWEQTIGSGMPFFRCARATATTCGP